MDMDDYDKECFDRIQRVAELETELAEVKAENAKLREVAKGAYFEGWGDGRNTTSVTGDPTNEWYESEARAALLEDEDV